MVVTSMASPDSNLDLSDTRDNEVSPNEHAVGEDDSAPGQQNVASNNNESSDLCTRIVTRTVSAGCSRASQQKPRSSVISLRQTRLRK
ncbi:hypothetical protein BSL78_23524 [Apostichopus japonicus]|uniref:Uncharacterized protein n=1 Tax=Stichopus japonicus TaxID=307972 RepID=A0A2G8JV48_STIJA|nr:hypothetical protein BSL78_23524 [Apostichopus japonicus]